MIDSIQTLFQLGDDVRHHVIRDVKGLSGDSVDGRDLFVAIETMPQAVIRVLGG